MGNFNYMDILHSFVTQYPQIKVSDYRPASLPCTLFIWGQNNYVYLYHYEDMFKQGFIIGCAEKNSCSRECVETGEGEMKAPDPTTAQMVTRVMRGQNDYAKQVMAALASLDDSEWAALKGIMDKLKKAGL